MTEAYARNLLWLWRWPAAGDAGRAYRLGRPSALAFGFSAVLAAATIARNSSCSRAVQGLHQR